MKLISGILITAVIGIGLIWVSGYTNTLCYTAEEITTNKELTKNLSENKIQSLYTKECPTATSSSISTIGLLSAGFTVLFSVVGIIELTEYTVKKYVSKKQHEAVKVG